eukprot:GILJ01000344.1.p1 GENE.GILJ01000344.1~~GILJ01000344.1.p1  ORF type:complete len:260 (+),score=18.85 GILJ01000344.1:119-781(+)
MSDDEEGVEGGWISWFCSLEGHEFFVEVDIDYIKDSFNLYGLRAVVSNYDEAMEMIISPDPPTDDELQDESYLEIYRDSTDLYGLIHARFITSSPRGIMLLREKFIKGKFGTCPRVLCEGQPVLPVGLSEELRSSRVKIFCPKCKDVYVPRGKYSDVDGAYFGPSAPHVMLTCYNSLLPKEAPAKYVPKIYGFKVHLPLWGRYKSSGGFFPEEEVDPNAK